MRSRVGRRRPSESWIEPATGWYLWAGRGRSAAVVSEEAITVIESDAWLLALALLTASTASTVYVWLEPQVRPVSVNDVVVDDPTEVAPPSR